MGYLNGKNLVSCEWVKENIDKIGIIDCRFKLGEPKYAKNAYDYCHIPKAVFVDLEHDLTGNILSSGVGGRHPLPNHHVFKDKIENLGIDNFTEIVIYDDGDLAGASRLWWLFRYFGKYNVKVMNGGINEWKRLDYDTTKEHFSIISNAELDKKVELKIKENTDLIAFQEDVKDAIYNYKIQLIDSRAPERYRGEIEPIDRIPGHIPSAINVPFNCSFVNGLVPELEELKKFYSNIEDSKSQIVYCGSGITGAVNVLLLDELGIKSRLYAGSYSDWVSNVHNKVEI